MIEEFWKQKDLNKVVVLDNLKMIRIVYKSMTTIIFKRGFEKMFLKMKARMNKLSERFVVEKSNKMKGGRNRKMGK